MDNRTMVLLISAFITLIIGISLLSVVASEGITKTTRTAVENETLDNTALRHPDNSSFDTNNYTTLEHAPTGWKSNDSDCEISAANGLVVKNATGGIMELDTDYNVVTTTGQLLLLNTEAINSSLDNVTLFDYTYCPDEYLSEGWNRNILNLVPGFFAIALLMISITLFYSVMRNEGLLGM